MVKLTKAQRELLAEVCASPRNCVKAYKPGPALVARGFAVWRNDDDYCGILCITDDGRRALADGGRPMSEKLDAIPGSAGRKIIDGVKDAVAGNFASVTIEGQRWVRADALGTNDTPLTDAIRDIASIHEKIGERGLLNQTAAIQELCRRAANSIEAGILAHASDKTDNHTTANSAVPSPRDGDAQFVQAWVLNEVLCEIMEGGTTESREIAARVVTHPRIKCASPPPPADTVRASILAVLNDWVPGANWTRERAADDILAALSVPAPIEAGWRDISTAPKDGTPFLAWCPIEPGLGDSDATPDGEIRVLWWEARGQFTSDRDLGNEIFTAWQPQPAPPVARNDRAPHPCPDCASRNANTGGCRDCEGP